MKLLAKKLKPGKAVDNDSENYPLKSEFDNVLHDKHSLISKFIGFWALLFKKCLSIILKTGILIVILIIAYLLIYHLIQNYFDYQSLISTKNLLQTDKSMTLSHIDNNDQKNSETLSNLNLDNDNFKRMQDKSLHNVKHQNINLILYIIRDKISLGNNYNAEFQELSTIYPFLEDPNYSLLKQYSDDSHKKVKDILEILFEEMSNKPNVHPNQNLLDFIKNFFTIKKIEESKAQASEHLLTKIIIQLLLNGEINSAYLIASKFSDQSEVIKKISIDLLPINQALNASNQMLRRVMLND